MLGRWTEVLEADWACVFKGISIYANREVDGGIQCLKTFSGSPYFWAIRWQKCHYLTQIHGHGRPYGQITLAAGIRWWSWHREGRRRRDGVKQKLFAHKCLLGLLFPESDGMYR